MEILIYSFFVNEGPFLHTRSMKTDFRSVQACNSRGKYEIISGMKKVNTNYQDRGFAITDYHGDNKFEPLQEFSSLVHLHTCAANEHIGYIEKSNQKIKERVRYGCHSIPYKKFTKLMEKQLVQYMVKFLNMYP